MTLESWNTVLQFASAVLLGLTFAVGAGAIFTNHILSKRQEGRIASVQKEAAEANKQAGQAFQRASEADERARALEVRAEELRRQNLELEMRLAHRRIGKADHDKFVQALRPYRGSVVNLTKLGDAEAADFADDIIGVLRDSGWNVQLSIIGTVSPPPYNLQCSVNESSDAGKALASVLKSLPAATVGNNPGLPVTAVIMVGLKPPP